MTSLYDLWICFRARSISYKLARLVSQLTTETLFARGRCVFCLSCSQANLFDLWAMISFCLLGLNVWRHVGLSHVMPLDHRPWKNFKKSSFSFITGALILFYLKLTTLVHQWLEIDLKGIPSNIYFCHMILLWSSFWSLNAPVPTIFFSMQLPYFAFLSLFNSSFYCLKQCDLGKAFIPFYPPQAYLITYGDLMLYYAINRDTSYRKKCIFKSREQYNGIYQIFQSILKQFKII